jgi:hypothetical protein
VNEPHWHVRFKFEGSFHERATLHVGGQRLLFLCVTSHAFIITVELNVSKTYHVLL